MAEKSIDVAHSKVVLSVREILKDAPLIVGMFAAGVFMDTGRHSVEEVMDKTLNLNLKDGDKKELSKVYAFVYILWTPKSISLLRKMHKKLDLGLDLEKWLKDNVHNSVFELSNKDISQFREDVFSLAAHIRAQETVLKALGYSKDEIVENIQKINEVHYKNAVNKEQILELVNKLRTETTERALIQ